MANSNPRRLASATIRARRIIFSLVPAVDDADDEPLDPAVGDQQVRPRAEQQIRNAALPATLDRLLDDVRPRDFDEELGRSTDPKRRPRGERLVLLDAGHGAKPGEAAPTSPAQPG